MARRLIEMVLPGDEHVDTGDLLKDHPLLASWSEELSENRRLL